MFTFENPDGKKGFQVFTLPFIAEGPLTPEGLKQELPDLAINDPHDTTVDGTPGLAFYSNDPDIGDTFEVWFVHDGLLYQVMTYPSLDLWLTDILKTWKFR